MQLDAPWCPVRRAACVESVPGCCRNEFNVPECCLSPEILGFGAAPGVTGRFSSRARRESSARAQIGSPPGALRQNQADCELYAGCETLDATANGPNDGYDAKDVKRRKGQDVKDVKKT